MYGNYVRKRIFIQVQELETESIPKKTENIIKEVVYKKPLILKQSKNCVIYIILWVISILICMGLLGFGLYLYLDPPKHHPNFEKLVTRLTYKKYQILKFRNIKTTEINYEFGNIDTPNEKKN